MKAIPDAMKRKLVKQGTATMMVSLPAKWIKQNELGKGSEIEMEQSGSNLIISSKGVSEAKLETEIKLVSLSESSIRTLITNTYRSGYDKVKVNFENEKQFSILKETIKTKLIGYDIIKREKNFCIVENITEPSSEQFETLMKKILFNISELFEITEKRLEYGGKKADNGQNYEDVEERIQSYDNFCRRVISKRKLLNNKSEFLWAFLTLVIHGQRELYLLNRYLEKNKPGASSKEILALLKEAKEMFEIIKKVYLEKNIDLLAAAHDKEKNAFEKTIYPSLRARKGHETVIVYHLAVCIRILYQSNSPLSAMVM